ncbi:hypothetical protein N7532_008176 [Penicillium argentinense]|uniref:Complex 1 LYR protein domain-containing protein n=1 Tax=Penicillium argentinense TaxID=1131581 RepID=A0A9W9K294_9EURO|nr:uncharacterized protein N7532_008176 [Penicillium argentinense]KAJ5089492.1 hypothetical protein N7532_008176 [Penicillium argentinense]
MLVPKLSGVHRFACLALYRALLRQCSPSTRTPPWLNQTKSLVKQRFRKYKGLESPTQIASSLKAGYQVRASRNDLAYRTFTNEGSYSEKTLDLLDSASKGNKKDADQIIATLEQTRCAREKQAEQQKKLRGIKSPRPLSIKQQRKEETTRFEEATRRRHPDTSPILSRPHPVKGIRKVPSLVSARGMPFLRIKKPQPKNLSGVLRNKLEKRWKRILRRDRLSEDLLFAQDEDAWDRLTRFKEPCTWCEDVQASLDEVNQQIRESDDKTMALAQDLWDVVLKERALAEKEAKQRQLAAESLAGQD